MSWEKHTILKFCKYYKESTMSIGGLQELSMRKNDDEYWGSRSTMSIEGWVQLSMRKNQMNQCRLLTWNWHPAGGDCKIPPSIFFEMFVCLPYFLSTLWSRNDKWFISDIN